MLIKIDVKKENEVKAVESLISFTEESTYSKAVLHVIMDYQRCFDELESKKNDLEVLRGKLNQQTEEVRLFTSQFSKLVSIGESSTH